MATNILMPALSPTMEEGKLAKWLVKEGDTVKSGTILAEIETDKATMEFEAVDEGKIGKILVPEGSEGVKVNAPIAVLLEEGEKCGCGTCRGARYRRRHERHQGGGKGAGPPHPRRCKWQGRRSVPLSPKGGEGGAAHAAPGEGARKPQRRAHLRLASGQAHRRTKGPRPFGHRRHRAARPHRQIRCRECQARRGQPAAAAPAAAGGAGIPGVAPLPDARLLYPAGSYEEIPHDSMRKAIAKRLTSAKTLIPHYYLTVDCNLDALMAVREKMNAAAPKGKDKVPAYKLSVNDFIMKASAMALMKHPDVNASWTDTAILRHKDADVGVAVALDFGLITPIIFKAQTKGLVEISNEVKTLAALAKEKKLKPNQYEGGGFSVSNLGMYGIKSFTSIINPPQSCIIAVGAGEERPVVRERQGGNFHRHDRHHVGRSPGGGWRHRRQVPGNLEAVHRRTCFDAVVRDARHG